MRLLSRYQGFLVCARVFDIVIQEAANSVQIVKHGIIGKGSFGVTYMGEFRGSQVAIKSVEVRQDTESMSFLRELGALVRAKHPNIMAFQGRLCL